MFRPMEWILLARRRNWNCSTQIFKQFANYQSQLEVIIFNLDVYVNVISQNSWILPNHNGSSSKHFSKNVNYILYWVRSKYLAFIIDKKLTLVHGMSYHKREEKKKIQWNLNNVVVNNSTSVLHSFEMFIICKCI